MELLLNNEISFLLNLGIIGMKCDPIFQKCSY